jgi:hypothetical protein
MKICNKCEKTKARSGFYRDRSKKDGLRNECKDCRREYEQSEAGKAAQRRYNQTAAGKAKRRAYKQTDKAKATAKVYDQSAVGKAVHKRYNQSPAGRESVRRASAKYKIVHQDRTAAHAAVSNEVKAGRWPPVGELNCAYHPDRRATVRHHHLGYAKKHWLDVVLLCQECHTAVHAED